MRKMRGLLAIVVCFMLIVGVINPIYAAEGTTTVTMSDEKICESLGMIIGEGNGLTEAYLSKTPNRLQAALLYLRLKGLEQEAKTYKSTSNFDDVNKVKWENNMSTNIMGYLKSHPELGMVGIGENKFSPDTYITAQGYYKILLEALGYKSGVDFKWEDTLTFAASKGMGKVANENNFTIKNLAVATVEALRANVKDSVDTLAGVLVRSGKFSEAQIKALKGAGIAFGSLSYEVSAKSSTGLEIKFNQAITDIHNVAFYVKKDLATIDNISGIWSQDGKELTISKRTKLDAGTYSVEVVYNGTSLGEKTLTVEAERVDSIEFVPKMIVKFSEIKGEVSFKALNQYGEDISSSDLVKKMLWSTTADSIELDSRNTKLIITQNGTGGKPKLSEMKGNIYVIAYDPVNNYRVSEPLEVSDGFGLVKDVKFLGIYNKDGKKDITVDTKDKFYIQFEALDAQGKKIESYAILSNPQSFGIYSTNPNITAHVVRDPDNMSKALIEIDTHTESGKAEIRGVALTTDKTANITVEVKKGAMLTEFIIEAPNDGLPIGERVEIPFKALDQNGNQIYGFDEINGKIMFISSDLYNASFVGERAQDGKYILTGRFKTIKKYTVKVIVIDGSKTNEYTIETKAPSVPTNISSIDRNIICNAIVENGQIKVDFVNNQGFKITDQNNKEFNMKTGSAIGGYYYYINASSLDRTKVAVTGGSSIAYKDSEIILVGGNTRGSTTVTFELCRDTDPNPINGGKEILDVKDVVITNIDRKEIVDYEIAPIKVLYANPDVGPKETFSYMTKQKQTYAEDIKVYGKMANGYMVALNPFVGPGNNVLNLTITDENKFNIDIANRKIIAKGLTSGNEAVDKLTATIQGANGVILTKSVDIKSSADAPIAKSIDAIVKPGSQIVKSGDSFTCSVSMFNNGIIARELKRYSSAGNDSISADIIFVITDQYGNNALTPSYFAVTKTQGTGNIIVNPSSGQVSGSVSVGDQYIITAVTNNGLTEAITLNIQ